MSKVERFDGTWSDSTLKNEIIKCDSEFFYRLVGPLRGKMRTQKQNLNRIFLWGLFGLILGPITTFVFCAESQQIKSFKSPYYGYQFSSPPGYSVNDRSNRAPAGFWLTVEKNAAKLELNIVELSYPIPHGSGFRETSEGVAVEYLGNGCDAVVQSASKIPTDEVEVARVVVKVSQCSIGPDSEYSDNWPKEIKSIYVINISQADEGKLLLMRPNSFPEDAILAILRSFKLFKKEGAQQGAQPDAGTDRKLTP